MQAWSEEGADLVRTWYGEGAFRFALAGWLYPEKSLRKNICFKTQIFLPLHFKKLSYGVMVAQQILDLFVLVRIQVGQQTL